MIMKNILFVGMGNSCRSPIAQGLAIKYIDDNNLNVNVVSAGLFPDSDKVSEYALEVLKKEGIDLSFHIPRAINANDVQLADKIVLLSDKYAVPLIEIYPESANKICVLGDKGIADPYGGDITMFENCLNEIKKYIPRIVLDTVEV